ncbi:Zinc finger protein CONSTANS-LIKE 4 [Glycine soja]
MTLRPTLPLSAALCLTCDCDIHYANPLASRHECIPVMSFFEFVHSVKASSPINFHHRFFSDINVDTNVSTKEAEAASWLLPNSKTDLNSSQYLFSITEPIPNRSGLCGHGSKDGAEKFRHRRQRHSGAEQLRAVHV